VTDCFVTHAHADHIGGFLWLLRSRIGEPGPCRLYGPPGLARHLEGFVRGILWDRIGPSGPVFEIAEINEGRVARFRLQAGQGGAVPLGDRPLESQVILDEPGFRVRAVALDHGTPVLAYAYEPDAAVKIRAARLAELKLPPGPWLTGLKRLILKGHYGAVIELPDGRRQPVGELAHDLALTEPGARLCYATDLADTAENRRLLVGLAAGAHTLFCEAPFRECDRDQARRTGHLTARACGEIAAAAGVTYLIPFHFSRRYEHDPWALYAEVAAACPQTVVPKRGPGGESEDAR
jgi:ribonuclease BN (tRNA processing enzyme)